MRQNTGRVRGPNDITDAGFTADADADADADAVIAELVDAMRANGAYAAVCAAVDQADKTGEDPGVLLEQSGGAEKMQQAAETSGFIAFAQRRSERLALARAARAAKATRSPFGAVRATPRVRERRERRHVARSTSSSDGPDGEPGEPPPPLGGFEKCPNCGGVLVWANGRLVCPRRSCPVAVVAG